MLKHASTLIAAAAFLFSLFRSPVRTLAIAALLGALWWYYDAHAGEIHQLTNQVPAAQVVERPILSMPFSVYRCRRNSLGG